MAFFNIMDLKVHVLLLLLLLSVGVKAQKQLQKMVLADAINLIQVNAANCFEVNVNTQYGNQISVEAKIEGEYTKDLDLELSTSGATIFVEANFTPNFERPNDKLSAHKVVSILLNITVPFSKNIQIYGTNARVKVQGKYNDVAIILSDGTCELTNVFGNVNVKTQSGNIVVRSKSAEVEAESHYGEVEFNPIPNGTSKYKLQTVTGNIELSKTE